MLHQHLALGVVKLSIELWFLKETTYVIFNISLIERLEFTGPG